MNEDFKMKILDEDIITKVLNTLPREYESLVDSLKVQMSTEAGVSLENLKEQLRSKFHLMKNIDTRSRRHESFFHTMSIKKKRVSKTKRPNDIFDTFGKGDTPQEEKKELSLFLSLSNAHAARGKYFH